ARLGQAQTTALGLYKDRERQAADAGRKIGQSRNLATAIAGGDRTQIDARLTELARGAGVTRAQLTLDNGGRFEFGRGAAVAPSTTTLVDAQGRRAGSLEVSKTSAQAFADDVRRISELDAVIVGAQGTLATAPRGM